jgi:hypothetical protein
MTGYTTDNYGDNIAVVTASMNTLQALYKQRARAAAEDEYMMPTQLTLLTEASHRARAASHILKVIKDHKWNSEHFFRELDRLMDSFMEDRVDMEATRIMYNVQNFFKD